MSGTTTFTNVWLRTETRMAVTTTTRSSRVLPDRSCVVAVSSALKPPPRRGWSAYRAACRLSPLLSNILLHGPNRHHLQNTVCPKTLPTDPEFGIQAAPYPIQQLSKCLAVRVVHAGEHFLLGPLPGAQDGLFQGTAPPRKV